MLASALEGLARQASGLADHGGEGSPAQQGVLLAVGMQPLQLPRQGDGVDQLREAVGGAAERAADDLAPGPSPLHWALHMDSRLVGICRVSPL